MRVYNMESDNGNTVPNQFVIYGNGSITFQSYDSEIITIDRANNKVTIGDNWNYSRTTAKYRNKFMREYAPTQFQNYDTTEKFRQLFDDHGHSTELWNANKDAYWNIERAWDDDIPF